MEKIENKIIELSRNKSEYVREEISKADAIKFFDNKSDNLKLDLLKDLNDGEITFYKQGNFIDLCKGPHIPNTKFIQSVKILNVAGAYWRGDEKGKQLTRIYGITFPKNKDLLEFIKNQEEAKKRVRDEQIRRREAQRAARAQYGQDVDSPLATRFKGKTTR